eukprot:TRINITY_DN2857_c0_g1_i1.p1 TRINITY_DN2857_c0_g1~~TRINITY_DN2857_c0_g1_i1.p1  ORF type:complete len:407 (-),score=102.47 TRINITY_DN2857_c0_g1_i1:23-1186(-)
MENEIAENKNSFERYETLLTKASNSFRYEYYYQTIKYCSKILLVFEKHNEIDEVVYELLSLSYQITEQYEEAILSSYQWIEKYGPTIQNQRIILESSYLFNRVEQIAKIQKDIFQNYLIEQKKKPIDRLLINDYLSLLLISSYYEADLGYKPYQQYLDEIKDKINWNERNKVLYGWIETLHGKTKKGILLINEIIDLHHEDDGFAASHVFFFLFDQKRFEPANSFYKKVLHYEHLFTELRAFHEIKPLFDYTEKVLSNRANVLKSKADFTKLQHFEICLDDPEDDDNVDNNNNNKKKNNKKIINNMENNEQEEEEEEEEEEIEEVILADNSNLIINSLKNPIPSTKSNQKITIHKYSSLIHKRRIEHIIRYLNKSKNNDNNDNNNDN